MWSLDRDLAYARHYPAVSWRDSSSRDAEPLADLAGRARRSGLGRAAGAGAARCSPTPTGIESVAQLVGADSLPAQERLTLLAARLLREAVLQQSAVLDNDPYSSPGQAAGAARARARRSTTGCGAARPRRRRRARSSALDLSPVLRARYETPPDGAEQVQARSRRRGSTPRLERAVSRRMDDRRCPRAAPIEYRRSARSAVR